MEVTNRLVHSGNDGNDGKPVVVPLVDPAFMYVHEVQLGGRLGVLLTLHSAHPPRGNAWTDFN